MWQKFCVTVSHHKKERKTNLVRKLYLQEPKPKSGPHSSQLVLCSRQVYVFQSRPEFPWLYKEPTPEHFKKYLFERLIQPRNGTWPFSTNVVPQGLPGTVVRLVPTVRVRFKTKWWMDTGTRLTENRGDILSLVFMETLWRLPISSTCSVSSTTCPWTLNNDRRKRKE